MNRRGFIAGLMGGAVLVAVPPPLRTFFLPPAGGWRPDDLTAALQARRIMDALARSMMHTKEVMAANLLNRGYSYSRLHYEDEPGRILSTDVTDDFYQDMAWRYVTKTQPIVV